MRTALPAFLMTAWIACAPARAATSIAMDLAGPGSTDVVLRWESDAAGPVSILRRELAPEDPPGSGLPLDPAADLWMTSVTDSPVILIDEARLDLSARSDAVARVYQVVDASGGCSNAGYVAARRLAGAGFSDLVALPPRSALRDARSLLETYPSLSRVEQWLPDSCRGVFLRRAIDGSLEGVNFEMLADRAVRLEAMPGVLVLAGAATSSPATVRIGPSPGTTCRPLRDVLALPWGTQLWFGTEVLCGATVPGEPPGFPDECELGAFHETSVSTIIGQQLPGARSWGQRVASWSFGSLHLYGTEYVVQPVTGQLVDRVRAPALARILDALDAGSPFACRCADSDGDHEDDCTERLFGSDPGNPASHGPDRDGDGARDHADVCPSDPDPFQLDSDGDGAGDACDPCPSQRDDACVDPDRDGLGPGEDDCPDVPNADQLDADFDGFGNACDNCVDTQNDQFDADADGVGDACDGCPLRPVPDTDGDLACDDVDNCPLVPNVSQTDADGDGFGDDCECTATGVRLPEVRDLQVDIPITGARYLRRLRWADDRPEPRLDSLFDVIGGSIEALRGDRGFARVDCISHGAREAEAFESFAAGSSWYHVARRDGCEARDWGSSAGGDRDFRADLDALDGCP